MSDKYIQGCTENCYKNYHNTARSIYVMPQTLHGKQLVRPYMYYTGIRLATTSKQCSQLFYIFNNTSRKASIDIWLIYKFFIKYNNNKQTNTKRKHRTRSRMKHMLMESYKQVICEQLDSK